MLPAHQRIGKTLETIRRLQACDPPPDEILVHVSSIQTEMLEALEAVRPPVRILTSRENLGPGGARNKMLENSSSELVVSLDDDSYPCEEGFFARVKDCFEALPEASILALNIYETGDPVPATHGEPECVPDFVGCGCAYRRSHFLEADGYVPIPVADGIEEADLALRYLERGRRVFHVPGLLIYHDTVLSHHASAMVAAMQVANTALMAFLRYPLRRWPLGMAQFASKWFDTLKRRRWAGALLAIVMVFSQAWRYRSYRRTVSAEVIDSIRRHRKADWGRNG